MGPQGCQTGAVFAVLIGFAIPGAATEVPFTMHSVESSFDGARCVRPADIDGDGDIDIVGAASSGDEVAWFENTAGDGSSWIAHTIEATTFIDGANSVGVADIDQDGDLDVFACAGTGNGIRWWENDGTPASGDWTGFWIHGSTLAAPNWVESGDVDGDGDPDVVAAVTTDRAIMWWENDDPTTGWWTQYVIIDVYDGAWSAKFTDLDGDGDLDILTSAITENMIAWWENDGTPIDGGWIPRIVTDTFNGAHGAYPADFDGDGDLDVVGASLSDDTIAWWESDGSPANGGWTEHIVDTTFDLAYDVAAADVDGDGDLDILGAAYFDDEITWWENDGTPGNGGWTERVVNAGFDGAVSVAAADLDGDGDADLMGAATVDDEIAWWENETIHRSATYPSAAGFLIDGGFSGEWPGAVTVADLDGDGDLDVAAVDPVSNDVVWWESDGNPAGGVWTEHSVAGAGAPGATAVIAYDIDRDGHVDLAVSHAAASAKWWKNDGTPANGGWVEVDTGRAAGTDIQVADVTGNGYPDLVVRKGSWCDVVENDGTPATGTWNVHSLPNDFFDSPPSLADIDRDGLLDVAGAGEAPAGDRIFWYENVGRALPHLPYEWYYNQVAESAAHATSLVDLDLDGDVDVLALLETGVSWWENDGTPLNGGWIEHSVGSQGLSVKGSIRAADLDADGDLDLVTTASEAGDLIWWESDGTPADGGWTQRAVDDNFAGVMSALTTDLDRDGDIDVVSAAETADELIWWQNRGGQFRLETSEWAPTIIPDGEMAAILEIEAVHNGRAGDHDEELATFALLFESGPGSPLTSGQANVLMDNLMIYLDDGDGVWTNGVDLMVRFEGSFSLTNGVQTLSLPDGSSSFHLPLGSFKRYFVVITAEGNASQQSPNTLVMSHLTDGFVNATITSAEDRDHDIPLGMEWIADTSSVTITFFFADPIFADDFELGNLDAWDMIVFDVNETLLDLASVGEILETHGEGGLVDLSPIEG